MVRSENFDAIIIGGGPAGATAAILLARAGWSVAMVEKKCFPRRKVCGECVSASNWPLLQILGIADPALDLAGPALRRVGLFSGRVRAEANLPPLRNSVDPWGRALGREHLDTLLLTRAAQMGVTLWQPWTMQAVERNQDIFHCYLSSSEDQQEMELRAPLVIAAHGSWEPGPLSTQVKHHSPAPSDLFAFKANFRHGRLPSGVLPVLAFPGGYGGMVVGGSGCITFACCIRRDALQRARTQAPQAPAAEAVLAYVQGHCDGVDWALEGAEREGRWLSVGPLRPGFRGHYKGGVWMLGNAACEPHPIIGEGITLAMQSAWLLCERLAANRAEVMAGRAWEAIGEDYSTYWRLTFSQRVRAASALAHAAMRPAVMAAVLPVLRGYPRLLTLAARWGGKDTTLSR